MVWSEIGSGFGEPGGTPLPIGGTNRYIFEGVQQREKLCTNLLVTRASTKKETAQTYLQKFNRSIRKCGLLILLFTRCQKLIARADVENYVNVC